MKVLYLGLDPSRYQTQGEIVHLPVIKIEPKAFSEVAFFFSQLPQFCHVILTSRVAADLFVSYAKKSGLSLKKNYICIGEATAAVLGKLGRAFLPTIATAEGVVDLLKTLPKTSFFFPHSARSRDVITRYLKSQEALSFPFYDTLVNHVEMPEYSPFDRIVFTSPSTVEAFIQLTGELPPLSQCEAIGPITQASLLKNSLRNL